MAVNPFETPRAAQPMREYQALPDSFFRGMQARQAEQAKLQMSQQKQAAESQAAISGARQEAAQKLFGDDISSWSQANKNMYMDIASKYMDAFDNVESGEQAEAIAAGIIENWGRDKTAGAIGVMMADEKLRATYGSSLEGEGISKLSSEMGRNYYDNYSSFNKEGKHQRFQGLDLRDKVDMQSMVDEYQGDYNSSSDQKAAAVIQKMGPEQLVDNYFEMTGTMPELGEDGRITEKGMSELMGVVQSKFKNKETQDRISNPASDSINMSFNTGIDAETTNMFEKGFNSLTGSTDSENEMNSDYGKDIAKYNQISSLEDENAVGKFINNSSSTSTSVGVDISDKAKNLAKQFLTSDGTLSADANLISESGEVIADSTGMLFDVVGTTDSRHANTPKGSPVVIVKGQPNQKFILDPRGGSRKGSAVFNMQTPLEVSKRSNVGAVSSIRQPIQGGSNKDLPSVTIPPGDYLFYQVPNQSKNPNKPDPTTVNVYDPKSRKFLYQMIYGEGNRKVVVKKTK